MKYWLIIGGIVVGAGAILVNYVKKHSLFDLIVVMFIAFCILALSIFALRLKGEDAHG